MRALHPGNLAYNLKNATRQVVGQNPIVWRSYLFAGPGKEPKPLQSCTKIPSPKEADRPTISSPWQKTWPVAWPDPMLSAIA